MSDATTRRSCVLDPSTCPVGMTPASALREELYESLGDLNLTTLGGWNEILDRVLAVMEAKGLLPEDTRPSHSDVAAELRLLTAAVTELGDRLPPTKKAPKD